MIESVHIVTKSVSRELLRVAAENSISSSDLYIKIGTSTTFIKDSNSNLVEIKEDDLSKYRNENYMCDASLEFEQECKIEILSKLDNYPFNNMNVKVEFEDGYTKANLIIQKGSTLKYYDNIYSDFIEFIQEQQLKAKILINLFDVPYKKSIKDFIGVLKQIKKITFKDDKHIPISEGLKEIPSIKHESIMTKEDSYRLGEEDNQGRVDYANRGFLISCEEGEQLFQFNKPQQGTNGRTCRGKIIAVDIVDLDAKPNFTIDNNIEILDSLKNIKYMSTKSGYLVKTGNSYDVSNSIDIGEISFKTTGIINTDLDNDISVNVTKENPLEDAIEKGMTVKVQNLTIKGSIGPSTQVEARSVEISGQTHNSSLIQCSEAKVGLHKGKITGHTVEIETLEGGEVIADIAIIKNAISGKIRAKTIKIRELGAYVTMEASEFIEVERIRGEENKFILDSSVKGLSNIDNNDERKINLKNSREEFKGLSKKFKDYGEKLKTNMEPCKKIKNAIVKAQSQGITISAVLIKNFKSCKLMKVRYKKLREEVLYQKTKIQAIEEEIIKNMTNILDSKVEIGNIGRGFNHITYKLENPSRDIKLNIHEDMKKKIFQLEENEEGILEIVNTD
ncbi:flagellar assembly protein A [Sulfurimonas sp.]|jgi:hypothetical protein|uniref:flagellar assembly protein A n=1 Tax=Sulfurimonas sp. TaxID=2022749 RepID=UPI0025DEC38A|nr:flagellar assembly protein A [Sulfurimonas sp.]MBT5934455.1 DUF342 domain-containing protein [Sulfurimonas sp.]